MFGIARAFLIYLMVLLMITGCGTGTAFRGNVTGTESATPNSGNDPIGGETGVGGAENAKTAAPGDGKTQVIGFKTDPPNATIIIDGKEKFVSPAEVCLTCDVDHSYEIAKDDYEKASGTIRSVRDYQQKSKVPGIVGKALLVGATLARGPFLRRCCLLVPPPGHPGHKAGPPRLEPDKIVVELAPESP